jgi:hypothetical protein
LSSTGEVFGQQQANTTADAYNAQLFMVQQMIGKIATLTLVKVVSVTNAGAVTPVGFVDVLPLVNQLAGDGTSVPHGTVYNIPYLRVQGGADAIILDPKVGDIGICGFASRDISAVKTAKGPANPGSLRWHDMADGLYWGGVLNGTPSQYVEFSAAGINITSPTKITITAPLVEVDASTSVTINSPLTTINGTLSQGTGSGGGTATLQGPVTVVNDLTAQGTSVHTHTHSGVQTGGGNTGAPN